MGSWLDGICTRREETRLMRFEPGDSEIGGYEHGDDLQITDWTGIRVSRTRKHSSLHRSLFTAPSDSKTGPKVARTQFSVSVFARLIVKGSRRKGQSYQSHGRDPGCPGRISGLIVASSWRKRSTPFPGTARTPCPSPYHAGRASLAPAPCLETCRTGDVYQSRHV